MKIIEKANIVTPCAVCNQEEPAQWQVFHIGTPEKPHSRIQYQAALYHDSEHGINFCSAACAAKKYQDRQKTT